MDYYIINLGVLCIGKNNYLFWSAPPYEFFLIVCVCVWVLLCRLVVGALCFGLFGKGCYLFSRGGAIVLATMGRGEALFI